MLLAWLATVAPPSAGSAAPPEGPTFDGALQALRAGDHDAALRDLRSLRESGKIADAGEFHYLVGRAELAAGRPERAVLPLRQASRTYAALPDYALFHLAEASLALGAAASTIDSLERLLVDHPESVLAPRARLLLADALVVDGRTARAREIYRQAIDKGGTGVPAHELRMRIADVLAREGAKDDCIAICLDVWRDAPLSSAAARAASRLDEMAVPRPVEARYRRALSLGDAGEYARALKEIDLLDKTKLPPDWRKRRAMIHFKARDYPAARADLERYAADLKPGPERAETTYWIARTFARANDYAAANRVYERLRKHYPESGWARDALYKQGLMALEEKNLAAAARNFELYATLYPTGSDVDEAIWYAGWSQHRMRKYLTAEATFRKLVERYPRSQLVPRALYWTGRGQILAGRREAGVATLSALARDQKLTYYGMLAAGGLAEAGETSLQGVKGEPAPAAAAAATSGPSSDEAPGPASAPAAPPAASDQVRPTGSAAFRFHESRARELVRLGFLAEAPLELSAARDAAITREQKLDLAHLSIAAEYFHGALNIVRTTLPAELESSAGDGEIYRLAYPRAYERWVTSVSAQYRYSPSVLWAIMREESTFRPEVVSPVGAIGLLQIMPYTGEEIAAGLGVKGFTPDRLYEPETNIGFSAWYVRKLIAKYGGNEALAIAGYNAGPEAVDRWLKQRGDLSLDEFIEEIPYTETRRYVKRVLMSYGIYEALYGKGVPRIRAARQVERASLVGSSRDPAAEDGAMAAP